MSGLLLSLAPALALGLLLVARRFPGERRLVALAERRRGRARPRESVRAPAGARTPLVLAPRGTALIARALAERPPPAALPI